MYGILRCARYAFSPNKLHLCGPDANREVFSYIKEGASDPGLEKILSAFHTMYPYLRHIAEANKIRDPFDDRVVEAYWIGNNLLETIDKKVFYRHIIDEQKIKKRVNSTEFNKITDKIRSGAVPHHSFHVFTIWKTKKDYDSKYSIENISVVDPDNTSVLEQSFDDSYITLITCTPPGTIWKRLIIKARIVKN